MSDKYFEKLEESQNMVILKDTTSGKRIVVKREDHPLGYPYFFIGEYGKPPGIYKHEDVSRLICYLSKNMKDYEERGNSDRDDERRH